ncbi:MAG: hypothetical protein K2X81_03895, partial [Candidatus Obscuribacterales bacterium]|nr:hypothetical protein [Candidatus Obscuribacterales bacterium]
MKNFIAGTFVALAMLATTGAGAANAEAALDFNIFDNYPLTGAYLFSEASSTGKSWVENLSAKLPVRTEPAFTPGASIELRYISASGGNWKAKLLHRPIRGQDPWDNGVFIQARTSPFIKPEILHMRLHVGDSPKETLPQVSLLLTEDTQSSSLALNKFMGKTDSAGWTRIDIPLTEFKGNTPKFAEQLKGLVFEQSNSDGIDHQIFIDQVELRSSKDASLPPGLKPEIVEMKGFERHVDIAWKAITDERVKGVLVERSSNGTDFKPVGYRPRGMNRYADYIGPFFGNYHYRIRLLGYDDAVSAYSNTGNASTHQMSDEELSSMVQEACARYYWDGAEENSGMALESVPGDPHMIATGASGFGISALVVAADRGFIPRELVAKRILKIVNFLEHADRFHGAMAHYYDGTSGHPVIFFGPVDNGGDLVETSFLMQGLLTARQFFNRATSDEKLINEKISKLWEAVEWDWYKQTPSSHYLYWHWSPDHEWKINHRLIGWNESMITYLLGIASPKHPIAPEMFRSGFESQEKLAQEYRGNAAGKMYTNGETFYGRKLEVGGFTGGPIFFTHYNFMGLDP